MTWRLYALLSGGAFVATYLVSGPPGTMPARAPQPRAVAASPTPTIAAGEIQELAARLEGRVRQATSYQTPTRNPFEFGRVRTPEPKQVPAPKLPEVPLVFAPPPPPFTLTGIAADHVNGELQRTAILSAPSGVTLAREGETVGLYKIVAIEENAVVLESTTDGTTRRLALR